MIPTLTLYHYWRSSSSWRVRWALEIKGIKANLVQVNLLEGESDSETHLKRNPFGYVPVVETGGKFLIESVAILEWLEEISPRPPLYPVGSFDRAYVRGLVEMINAGTQPIQNLNVLEHYSDDANKKQEWASHFIVQGLKAYERRILGTAGKYSFGDEVTAADLYLVPQIYNAHRFEVDMSPFPKISEIYDRALATKACQNSHPDRFKP